MPKKDIRNRAYKKLFGVQVATSVMGAKIAYFFVNFEYLDSKLSSF